MINCQDSNSELFMIPAVECTRPMCFKTIDSLDPYATGGTCFVIRFRQRLWGVTAKHALGLARPDQVMIPYKLGSHRFFSIADAFTHKDYADDSGCTDFAIFEIDEVHIDQEHFDETTVYNLDSETDFQVTDSMLVAVHGFPTLINKVDSEKTKFEHERLSIPGKLGLKSPMTGCRYVNLLCDGGIADHDGFSGCPVFVASQEFGQRNSSKLLGVNTRGSAKLLTKHYVEVSAIKSLIDYHLKQDT